MSVLYYLHSVFRYQCSSNGMYYRLICSRGSPLSVYTMHSGRDVVVVGCMYYKRIRTMQFQGLPTEYSVCT